MKAFITVVAMCVAFVCFGEIAQFPLRTMSVYQRGILKTASEEAPIEVFSKGAKLLINKNETEAKSTITIIESGFIQSSTFKCIIA